MILTFSLTLFVFLTFLPLSKSGEWWIRIWDFPRLHLFLIGLILIFFSFYLTFKKPESAPYRPLLLVAIAALLFQIWNIMPFTQLYPTEVRSVGKNKARTVSVRFYIANILVTNERFDLILQQIQEKDPDIIILTEPNKKWDRFLQEHLEISYPHHLKAIRDDGHGLAVWSRFTLKNGQVHHLISDDRPSLSTEVLLPNEALLSLWVVHPAPPGIKMTNDERKDSRPRDAELLLLAKKLEKLLSTTVVAGDFNDTGWSPITKMFKETSGLRDPRVGRGLFNTYPVSYPFFRCPIDHIFVSNDLDLIDLQRLEDIGSDHFPIFASFALSMAAPKQETETKQSEETKEIIQEGKKQAEQYENYEEKK